MLLTGSYRRALDDKLRLAIPKPLREQLSAGDPLYLTPGLDGCLAVYPPSAFAALAERLAAGSPAAREVRDYSRLFYSQASSVVPDAQWRFRVTPELTKWADLGPEVMVVGVRDHIEVWASERWDRYVARCDPQYDQLAELALVGAVRSAQGAPPAVAQDEPRAIASSADENAAGRILPR
jgi:MraZ protein